MADTALVIVEGRVTDIEKRSGTKDGNSWTMETLHVLVANRGMVEINSPRTWGVTGGDIPAIGDDVSWLVRLTAGRFGLSGSIAGLAPRPLNSAGQTASTVHDLSDHTGASAEFSGIDFASLAVEHDSLVPAHGSLAGDFDE